MRCVITLAIGLPLVFSFSTPKHAPLSTRRVLQLKSSVDVQQEAVVADEANNLPHVVVVGAGWGGWGATKALLESGCKVTLVDAQPDPSARNPATNKNGKPVDVGQRGFWKDYPNIEALASSLNLKEEEVWTPFTNSSFYSPQGLEATAPVFSSSEFPQLPSPLGQVLATFPLFERLPLEDRASMAGLLVATLDCLAFDEGGDGPDAEVLAAYDRMSAHDLFVRFKLSKRLVEDFIKPTLLVGLFKPPEELSALVVMELLFYYALAHQDSFDVRWIRRGTVASSLIAPLAAHLEKHYPLTVLGGTFVTEVADGNLDSATTATATASSPSPPSLRFKRGDRATTVRYTQQLGSQGRGSQGGSKEVEGSLENVAGVVLALGAKGMKSVVGGSPLLSQHSPLAKAASLQGIDVLSCRLWLDSVVPTRTPANVLANFEALRGAGGTFFMLDQLQVHCQEDDAFLWGEEDKGGKKEEEVSTTAGEGEVRDKSSSSSAERKEEDASREDDSADGSAAPWRGPRGSVVACDFYNAGALLGLNDADVVSLLVDELLPQAVPAFKGVSVVDSWVAKFPGAVSWFSPGSFDKRPKLHGAGKSALPNVKCAGDWVRLGEKEHGAKGLCQERAFVSGLEAANALLEDLKWPPKETATAAWSAKTNTEPAVEDGSASSFVMKKHAVLPVRENEPQVKAGIAAARKLPKPLRFWVR